MQLWPTYHEAVRMDYYSAHKYAKSFDSHVTNVRAADPLLKQIGDTWRARVLAVNGVSYTSQNAYQLYFTSGGARDWYFSEAKIPYSFTVCDFFRSVVIIYSYVQIELRDTGTYGFQLPAAQIIPTGNENYAGFTYYLQAALGSP